MSLKDFAPAKINLCLHVTGRREDGYHLLDSIVVFAQTGDHLTAEPAAVSRLSVSGPFGQEIPEGGDNLVLRAAKVQAPDIAVKFNLEKHLPPASGIGGGSSDAAAAVRLVAALDPQKRPIAYEALTRLGADIPVCLGLRPARMRGVGEIITELPPLPHAWLLLANPRVEVPTPAVFRALECRDNPALPEAIPAWQTAADLAQWLLTTRNDLEAPAISQAPVIADLRQAIAAQEGCLLARMSGSGATCFGLFATEEEATKAATHLQSTYPSYWVAAAKMMQ